MDISSALSALLLVRIISSLHRLLDRLSPAGGIDWFSGGTRTNIKLVLLPANRMWPSLRAANQVTILSHETLNPSYILELHKIRLIASRSAIGGIGW